jgi:DNA-binding transcriptional MerR regulator
VTLYWGSIVAALALAAMWVGLCTRSFGTQQLGVFFSYRCMHPASGVSPSAPALLVLSGWYFWALLHARRLRLTMDSRPVMPDAAALESEYCPSYKRTQPDMFVSDTRLQIGLLEDTTCLMISRRLLHQIFRVPAAVPVATDRRIPKGASSGTVWKSTLVDTLLMLFLAALAALWIGLCPMRAIDHFGRAIGPTTLYELFMGLLLVPLLVVALCAAARLFLMSASLRAHLLEPLERMPLRQAFTRLKGFHWVSMLRESGQLERWRDMSRSTEGIRQILNDPEMPIDCMRGELAQQKMELEEQIAQLQQHVKDLRDAAVRADTKKRAWEYMGAIEKKYATCSETILCCILLPHWLRKRHSLMQSVSKDAVPEKEPNIVLLAEELLAIRYVAIIRAVLAQMRYLLLFITMALVLIMLATNSYPFQPKQEIDWCVTGLFLSFSAGIVLVLAQMHRNPLLSRITNKNSKSLGLDFYLRVAGFGAVPLITWLATQYPSIGGTLYGVLKPGLEVMK